MSRETAHRADLGRAYEGRPVHAAAGVHEHAADLVESITSASSRILEVGAGSGALAHRLRARGRSVEATDLEPEYPEIQTLDISDPVQTQGLIGAFDCVVCVETIEHVENPRDVLRRLRDLVKPGGYLVLSTPNVGGPHSRIRTLLRGAPTWFGPDQYYSTGHITILPDWLLLEHLKSAGFTDVSMSVGGSFGHQASWRRTLHRMEVGFVRRLTRGEVRTDGACLFAVAKNPAS